MATSGMGWYCQDCGHRFKTVAAAQRAMDSDRGCPKCGAADVDFSGPLTARQALGKDRSASPSYVARAAGVSY